MGTFSRLYFRLSSSWDGGLVAHAKLLPWINSESSEQLDATDGGSFMSLTLGKAKTLMEKIASNQGWSSCNKREEVLEEMCALSTKMDALLNWLEQ